MKKIKHTIHSLYHTGTGRVVYVTRKPTKNEIKDISKKEDWQVDSSEDVCIEKLDIYDLGEKK
jgi:hypothetical protein